MGESGGDEHALGTGDAPDAPDVLETADAPAEPHESVRVGGLAIVFGAFLTLLIPFFLWAGRGEWFQHDDWDYIVLRKVGNAGDLFRPHNGHWETIPVLVYRTLWTMFGLTYRPYQLVSILASLAGAVLLLVVLRRAHTRPWIALVVATLLVFFGEAQANVALRVTSITFVGFAMPLGLTQLVLADHDGPLRRRDWYGAAVGVVSLMCSGVALAMLFVVGLATLVKRGWRVALFHVVPAAVVFSIWYAAIGHSDVGPGHPAQFRPLPLAVHFAAVLVTVTFEAFTRLSRIGGVLVIGLVIGFAFLVWRAGAERRKQAVIPGALLVGAFFFAFETGLGRADLLKKGSSAIRSGHYMDVVAYLVLPAVAFVAEEVVRRWRLVAPALLVAFLVILPLNVHAMVSLENKRAPKQALVRNVILQIPRLPVAKQVPPGVEPYNGTASPVTVGWLLGAAREGRVPNPPHVTRVNTAIATMRISLQLHIARSTACHPFRRAIDRELAQGASFDFRGAGIRVSFLRDGRPAGMVTYSVSRPADEWRIVNVGAPLTLRFNPNRSRVPVPLACD